MVTSQRLRRGFNRLGLLLAAIPLVGGIAFSILVAQEDANSKFTKHQVLVCAHQSFGKGNDPIPRGFVPDPAAAEGRPAPEGQASDKKGGPWELYWQLSLKDVGCSSSDKATVSYAEARDLPAFNWIATFVSAMMPSMAITLAITLAVYSIVRAIGWVLAALQRPS